MTAATNRTQAAYAPDAARILRPGERAELARFDRAATALERAQERGIRLYGPSGIRARYLKHFIDGIDHGDHTYSATDEHEHHQRAERVGADQYRRAHLFARAIHHSAHFSGTAWQVYYRAALACSVGSARR